MEAPGFKKRLVLSLGEHTFLYLATDTRKLSEGHCYIVPIRHTPASTVSFSFPLGVKPSEASEVFIFPTESWPN